MTSTETTNINKLKQCSKCKHFKDEEKEFTRIIKREDYGIDSDEGFKYFTKPCRLCINCRLIMRTAHIKNKNKT